MSRALVEPSALAIGTTVWYTAGYLRASSSDTKYPQSHINGSFLEDAESRGGNNRNDEVERSAL